LVITLLLAAFLRFWHLGTLLDGFHNDEVMNGYVGRYILQNGFDLYGNRWPIFYFNNFGDYPNVLPMYLSGFFTYLLGVNVFAVRFPIALAGVCSVGLVYVIGRWLYRSRLTAFLVALTLALAPWHIVLSRATSEGITASFVFLIGIFLLFLASERSNSKLLLLGGLTTLLTYFLYPGFRVLVPLALFPLPLLAKTKAMRYAALMVISVVFVTTFAISQTVWGKGRYDQTSLFTHNNTIGGRALNYSLGLGSGRILEARIFHNKIILAGREFLRQYFSYFSFDFLAGFGGMPQRYRVPEHGQLYWSLLALPLVSVIWQFWYPQCREVLLSIFQQQRARYGFYVLWIFLLSPVPAALTLDDVPNVHRSVLMVVVFSLVSGFFWSYIAQMRFLGKRIVLGLLVTLMVLESVHFWHYYRNLASASTTAFRKGEQSLLAKYLRTNVADYSAVYVPSGEMLPVHYLFQQQNFDPELAQQFETGILLDQIDKVIFVEEACPSALPSLASQSGILLVDRAECRENPAFIQIDSLKQFTQTDAYKMLRPASDEATLIPDKE